ncbi:MAG: hypothetical protein QNJ47_25565 [Nostocaceae cyanobacterium]|nr:hypothetical protein [Nostocaceae cyanobacterium]
MDKKLEINDLLDDAINNALARRQGGIDSEDGLLGLSEEEASGIGGGLSKQLEVKQLEFQPIDIDPCVIDPYVKDPYVAIAGYRPICPPIVVGLIAWDPKEPVEIYATEAINTFES